VEDQRRMTHHPKEPVKKKKVRESQKEKQMREKANQL
jgi:hypothetical protein